MTRVHRGRYTADISGEFVVLLIGMRINKPWKIHRWWPTFRSMSAMLKHLRASPEDGLLGFQLCLMRSVGPTLVQYWRSYEHLNRFARDPEAPHLGMWRWFNRQIGASGDVGIWHETFQVRDYECLYSNMPAIGLAAAARHVPVADKGQSSARRIGATLADDVVVPYYENP